MPTFALMAGNTVSNLVAADDKVEAETALNCTLIEITAEKPAGIGYIYDPIQDIFIPPIPTEDE